MLPLRAIQPNNDVWKKTNRKIDYWPFVSTIVNLAKIIFKVALHFHPPSLDFFKRWHITDLETKSFTVCILLLIPGINIIVASARDIDVANARDIDVANARDIDPSQNENPNRRIQRRHSI